MNANERFGRAVTEARKRKGITQSALAGKLGVSAGHMSNLATGRRPPAFSEVATLDSALGTNGRLSRLWDELTDSGDMDFLDKLEMIERSAESILAYEVTLIPALLQTAAYARTIIHAGAPWMKSSEIEAKVASRMDRADWLVSTETPLMHVVVDEGVITRTVGSPEIMQEQLRKLVDLVDSERIVLQVIPMDELRHPGLTGALWILSPPGAPDVAYAESVYTGQHVDDQTAVARYRLLFGKLQSAALRPSDSARFVREQIERA